MIDNLRIALDSPYSPGLFDAGEPSWIGNLLFTPCFDRRTGETTYHTANLKNMRVRHFHNSGKLVIDNSLHKYAQGSNYSDFPLSQIRDAVDALSNELGCDVKAGKINRLEYGIVIAGLGQLQPYKGLLSCGVKEYTPMQFSGLVYGANCVRSQYTIKGYNKTLEVKRHEGKDIAPGLFRWEVAVDNMQCLHKRRPQVPIFQVSDLLETGKLGHLATDLVDKYKNSNKKPLVDYSGLKLKEVTAIARLEHSEVKQAIMKNNKELYRKDQRLHKAIQKKANEWPEKIERLIAEKCQQLIHS